MASTRLNDMYSDKKQVVESALSHLKRGTKDIYDKAAHLKERKSLIQGWSQEIISMFHNNNQGS
jgi:hypothetical protein